MGQPTGERRTDLAVGIGLLTLVPGRIGGSETYVRELLRALGRRGSLDYCVYLPEVAAGVVEGLPSRTITAYRSGHSTVRRASAMVAATVAPSRLRRQMSLHEVDAVHFPLTVALPTVAVPTAVTVHDLYHELFPSALPRHEVAWRRATWRKAIRGARMVIAVSDTVRKSLIELYDIDRAAIRVIHHGVDREWFRPASPALERESFLLLPAHNWPNKNHSRLLEAFSTLRRRRPALRLVLTGHGHEQRRGEPGVDVRGYVPAAELRRLYQTASAVVFPSLYEGFGQPPLEAMACGCPVAAAFSGAIPEVCDGAARLFDPLDVDGIVAATEEVLDDGPTFAARGLKRARHLSWDASAAAHEQVYRELAPSR